MAQQFELDYAYLQMAYIWGQNLSKDKTYKVGCLIVKDGQIISDGFNGTLPGFDNVCEDCEGHTKPEVCHAEWNALGKLMTSTISSEGATLYCIFAPCYNCAKLIIRAKISRVVYSLELIKYGTEGLNLLKKANINCNHIYMKLAPFNP